MSPAADFTSGPTSITANGTYNYLAKHAKAYSISVAIDSSLYELSAAASTNFTITQRGLTISFTGWYIYNNNGTPTYTDSGSYGATNSYRTGSYAYTYAGETKPEGLRFKVNNLQNSETIGIKFSMDRAATHMSVGSSSAAGSTTEASTANTTYTKNVSNSNYVYVLSKNIGAIKVSVTGIADGTTGTAALATDYSLTTKNQTVTISKKTVTPSWGSTSSYTYTGSAQGRTATVSATLADGGVFAGVYNFGWDALDEIELAFARQPKTVEILGLDGKLKPAKFRVENGVLKIARRLEPMYPVFIKAGF